MLNFTVVPTDHDATPQLAAYEGGRKKLLQMSFRDLERALIDVLDRSVNKSGGDFEPQRDIHSIMINRWNYGYAHELTSVWDPSLYGPWANQPQVRGRRPVKNVSIANSDSARVRLHPQRDQRGLPGGAGPARLTRPCRAACALHCRPMKSRGLIGAGNMAAALARGWGDPVLATDSGSGKAAALAEELGGEAVASNDELAVTADVSCSPTSRPSSRRWRARRRRRRARSSRCSRAPRIEELRAAYPDTPVVRVQPNTPAEVGRGVTLLAEPAEEPLAGEVEELFGRVGVVVRVPEGIIDASAACSGVGPAYWALVAEAWVEAAIRRGIPAPIAQPLVTETMAGSAELLRAREHDTLRPPDPSPRCRSRRRPLVWLPTGLLLGGAAGNLIDRLDRGYVTDFIDLPLWPAFNLADMAITFGVLSLLYVLEGPPRHAD